MAEYSIDETVIHIRDYELEIRKPLESDDDALEFERQRLQVVAEKDKVQHYLDFVTTKYLSEIFDILKEDGECELYYPNRILAVRDLSVGTVEQILKDVIDQSLIEFYFKNITVFSDEEKPGYEIKRKSRSGERLQAVAEKGEQATPQMMRNHFQGGMSLHGSTHDQS